MNTRQGTDHDQRIANVIQLGVVEEVDYANPPRARVRIGDRLTGWLRIGAARAGDAQVSWGVSPGEEVVIGCMGGDTRQGVILSALANGAHPADAEAGTFRVSLAGGVVIEVAGGAVHITAPGDVHVSGDVIADGISLKHHVHGGILPGPAETGEPV